MFILDLVITGHSETHACEYTVELSTLTVLYPAEVMFAPEREANTRGLDGTRINLQASRCDANSSVARSSSSSILHVTLAIAFGLIFNAALTRHT